MENFNLITPGEKIKNIRKTYNFRQHEISGNDITRNLISMIERGESNLTKTTATIIANNINNLCIKKNINYSVTPEYLLESVEDQLNSVINKFIDCTKSDPSKIYNGTYDDILLNIEKNINIYSSAKDKFNFYMYLGDVFDEANNPSKSYFYYLRAYENSGTSSPDEISSICSLIGYSCIRLQNYSAAINYNKIALYENEKRDLASIFAIRFNSIIALISLENYDDALNEITYVEENLSNILKSNPQKHFYFCCLKSNCYKGMKKYDLANTLNKNMLKNNSTTPLCKIILFTNIIEIYIETKDMKNLKIYLNKFYNYLESIKTLESNTHLASTYYSIGLGYLTINERDIARTFFNKSFQSAKEFKNEKYILQSLNQLVNLSDDSEKVIASITKQFMDMVQLKFIPKYNYVLMNILNLYSKRNDCTNISKLINFINSIDA